MIRVGAVAYANTWPLVFELEDLLDPLAVTRGTPGEIAEGLEAGRLDVGLVPVATLAAHPEWEVVPGLGIACRGAVESVLLLSREAVGNIRTLVTDPASRTSNVLAELWLSDQLEVPVEVIPGDPAATRRLDQGDATVVIGDEALDWADPMATRVDLGRAWREWTGLPFVFALWAGPGAGDPRVRAALHRCLAMNECRLPAVAESLARAQNPHGEPAAGRVERLQRYLEASIVYRLGEAERQGLDEYLRRGRAAGHLPTTERPAHVI